MIIWPFHFLIRILTPVKDVQTLDMVNAALDGNHTVILKLIASGADVNGKVAYDGSTALHSAAMAARAGTVTLLVENGADVNIQDGKGMTPLHFLIAVQLSRGWAPAQSAMKSAFPGDDVLPHGEENFKETVATLIEAGADINAVDNNGRTLIDTINLYLLGGGTAGLVNDEEKTKMQKLKDDLHNYGAVPASALR